jgi:hypothetical protein
MKQVERPSPVLVATLNHDFYRFADTMIGFDSCILQMIESPQNSAKTWERRNAASVRR